MISRYGYHPDDQCPDYGDGRAWDRALALHHRQSAASSLARTGESHHSAQGVEPDGAPGPATADEREG